MQLCKLRSWKGISQSFNPCANPTVNKIPQLIHRKIRKRSQTPTASKRQDLWKRAWKAVQATTIEMSLCSMGGHLTTN